MIKFYDYETSRGIINSLNDTIEKKIKLIEKLEAMPDITPEIVKDYLIKNCEVRNVEVDIMFSGIPTTIIIQTFRETKELSLEEAECIAKQRELEVIGCYIV